MTRYFLIALALVMSPIWMVAQQEAQFTQFVNNQLQFNPGYAGVRNTPSVRVQYRKQWIGFDGAPESKLVSFSAPLFKDKVGLGLTVSNTRVGIMDQWFTSMAYSYRIRLSENFHLYPGVQGTLKYYGIDFSDKSVVTITDNDPSILAQMDTRKFYGNFGAGIYGTYKNTFFGVSVPHMYQNTIGFNLSPVDDIIAAERQHYYATAGSVIKLNNILQLRPAVLVKYVKNAPIDVDINMMFTYDYELSLGATYRTGGDRFGESIDVLALYQLNRLGIGISYDFTMSQLRKVSAGAFEIMARWDFVKERSELANPRFFF